MIGYNIKLMMISVFYMMMNDQVHMSIIYIIRLRLHCQHQMKLLPRDFQIHQFFSTQLFHTAFSRWARAKIKICQLRMLCHNVEANVEGFSA